MLSIMSCITEIYFETNIINAVDNTINFLFFCNIQFYAMNYNQYVRIQTEIKRACGFFLLLRHNCI